MRPTELIRRFSGLLAICLLAGVYWLSSRLGGHLEPCVITTKVAGMSLSPDAVQTLIDERLVRIDPDRSTRSMESYVRREGVADERLVARITEILEVEAEGASGRPPRCSADCELFDGELHSGSELRFRRRR